MIYSLSTTQHVLYSMESFNFRIWVMGFKAFPEVILISQPSIWVLSKVLQGDYLLTSVNLISFLPLIWWQLSIKISPTSDKFLHQKKKSWYSFTSLKKNMHFVYEQLMYILHQGIYVANIRRTFEVSIFESQLFVRVCNLVNEQLALM